MARRGLSDDKRLEISLTGCARRHALEDTPPAEAIADLTTIAKGRADLLAEAAGIALGGWLALPGSHHPRALRAAALLVEAGADPTLIQKYADQARAAATSNHHTTQQLGGAPNGSAEESSDPPQRE